MKCYDCGQRCHCTGDICTCGAVNQDGEFRCNVDTDKRDLRED